jgi:diacylglycerol kinase (ATP)
MTTADSNDATDTIQDAPELPRPITMIVNANSRKGRELFDEAVKAVRDAGIPLVEAHAVKDKKETAELLHREIAAGAKTVIVGGGDGTLSACADILVNTEVAMAVLPLGTGNTFVRSLGISVDLPEAAKIIAAGQVQSVDVGRCNGQIFLNSVAIGLSCEIAGALTKNVKKKLGLLAWPVVGTRVLASHRPLQVRVTAAEKSFSVRTHQLIVVNGRYVAGPIASSPDASLQDHSFDVFTLGGATFKSLIIATWKWLRGNHTGARDTRFFTTRKLTIASLRRPLPANVDGEINDKTPLELEVLPAALRVVVPHGYVASEA